MSPFACVAAQSIYFTSAFTEVLGRHDRAGKKEECAREQVSAVRMQGTPNRSWPPDTSCLLFLYCHRYLFETMFTPMLARSY